MKHFVYRTMTIKTHKDVADPNPLFKFQHPRQDSVPSRSLQVSITSEIPTAFDNRQMAINWDLFVCFGIRGQV